MAIAGCRFGKQVEQELKMILGINHITIAVKDLAKAFVFYNEVLGFEPLMRHQKGAYFLAGDAWFCLDLDPDTRTRPLPEYTHFAFSIAQADFKKMQTRIEKSGAHFWKENASEGN
jgi:catechol 2,3-dioxygenase-like lactoylglutathione lyase family enzyme